MLNLPGYRAKTDIEISSSSDCRKDPNCQQLGGYSIHARGCLRNKSSCASPSVWKEPANISGVIPAYLWSRFLKPGRIEMDKRSGTGGTELLHARGGGGEALFQWKSLRNGYQKI